MMSTLFRWAGAVGLLGLLLLALLAGMAGGFNVRLVELLRVWAETLVDVIYWAIVAAVLLAIVFGALAWWYRRRRTRAAATAATAVAAVAPNPPPAGALIQGTPETPPPAPTGPPDHIPRATFDHVPARDVESAAGHANGSTAPRFDDVSS